jgi:hypothetical protein
MLIGQTKKNRNISKHQCRRELHTFVGDLGWREEVSELCSSRMTSIIEIIVFYEK